MADEATLAFRRASLEARGASSGAIEELLAYTAGVFRLPAGAPPPRFPLEDEPHVEAWVRYAEDAARDGAFPALAARFPQLAFPIEPGVSQREDYRAATRRGVAPAPGPALALARPDRLRLEVRPSLAGRVPILVAGERADFETLVQAFTSRNEPEPVPASMGACIVTGYNNWDRVRAHRARFEQAHPGADEAAWQEEFQRMVPLKALYQDRFIILSTGPYSGVPAGDAGFDPVAWTDLSVDIRREHELTHYFTYRVFGAMRNNLADELLADWVGLVRTLGRYRADLALRFLGLEDFPRYRAGGRFENYRGKPALGDEAFRSLQGVVVDAVRNLERAEALRPADTGGEALARWLVALAALTLEEIASPEWEERLGASAAAC